MRLRITICLAFTLTIKLNAQSFSDRINNISEFEKLSGLPLSEKYGQVSAVKIVFDLEKEKLYFINSKYYKYHHEFCRLQLNYNVELAYFNKINYSNDPKRRFLLANINHFKSLGVYALEISPVDLMDSVNIIRLYDIVSKATFTGSNLKFLLNSSRFQNQQSYLRTKLPVLNPADVYKNLEYQAISKYVNYGTLKFIDDFENEMNNLTPTDIIVLNEAPVFLPKVAGIIVTEFQTPLSHLTILGQNRKIPISAYRMAFQDERLRKLSNKKICYTVLSDTFRIERVDKILEIAHKQKEIKLKSDLTVDSLVDIEDLDKRAYRYCGNKASNFGILYDLSKKGTFKTPESAFVIPFYFYQTHLKNSKAGNLIDKLLSDESLMTNNDSLKVYLKCIRDEIKKRPLDSTLYNLINNKIISLGNYTRMRFRSSTNAEDAKGFSGAGLYSSKTGILGDRKKSIDKAIKQVWASLWSYEAFTERAYYNINHRDVYMGILVNRSFPEEEVNGVAITKNLYRKDNYGFVVNAQLGDESVVRPESGNVTDQFICYPNSADNIYENKNTVDIITLSNLNNGKLLMTDEEIQNLANQLDLIKKYFAGRKLTMGSYLDFGLDVEFKLDKESRDLYIKQVRFYND